MPRMTLAIALAVFVAIVVALLLHQRSATDRARSDWSAVPGRIVESRVVTQNAPGADRPAVRYGAQVVYEYRVGDRTYRGERIRFGGTLWRFDPQGAEADRARYPEGADVTVRHDPGNPTDAVLEVDR